jgi:hypothetical protein
VVGEGQGNTKNWGGADAPPRFGILSGHRFKSCPRRALFLEKVLLHSKISEEHAGSGQQYSQTVKNPKKNKCVSQKRDLCNNLLLPKKLFKQPICYLFYEKQKLSWDSVVPDDELSRTVYQRQIDQTKNRVKSIKEWGRRHRRL